LAIGVAEGFDDLRVGVAAAASELDEHGASVAQGARGGTTLNV
jgi:hypothetical protein